MKKEVNRSLSLALKILLLGSLALVSLSTEQLKSQTPLSRIVSRWVTLRPQGREMLGLCPFHADRNPSLGVNDEKGVYLCRACGATGDHFKFIEKITNCDFKQAVATFQEIVGGGEGWNRAAAAFRQPMPETRKATKGVPLENWHPREQTLWSDAGAQGREFLKRRGIAEGTAKRFHLGLLAFGRMVKVSESMDADEKERRKAMQDSPWLAVPYLRGRQVIFAKYRATRELPSGAQRYMAEEGAQQPALWNEDAIDPLDNLYLTEGELDALTLEQAGFRAVSFGNASKKLTPTAKDAVLHADKVFLAGDNEASGVGMAAMERLLKDLGQKAHILLWPRGEAEKRDANSYFIETCSGNVEEFHREVVRLTAEAAQPHSPHFRTLVQIIDEQRAMGAPINDPLRLRMPWPSADHMALIVPGDTIAVFGSTGTGKSSLVTQICLHNSDRCRLVWTPDLKPHRHTRLVVAQMTHRNKSLLSAEDYDAARGEFKGQEFYLGYDPDISTPKDTFELCEQAVQRLGGEILVIDHINYVVRNVPSQQRVSAYEDAMLRLNAMAEKYGLIVIVLAQERKRQQGPWRQLNRPAELEDLKYAGAIVEDAAAVIHLHRDRMRGKDNREAVDEESGDNLDPRTLVRMLKGREQAGAKQWTKLFFRGEMGLFEELHASGGEES